MPEPEPSVVHPVCGGRTDTLCYSGCEAITARGMPQKQRARAAPYGAGPGYVVRQRQAGTMFSACGPFWPCVMSKATFWPSRSSR